LSPKVKIRYKAINLYSSGNYSIGRICEIFEINRSTFYSWRKRYKQSRVQSLEDRPKRPHKVGSKVVRNHSVEQKVYQIRRKYPYFGKKNIKRILEKDYGINISVSSVGRILTQYRSILPKVKMQNKRTKTLKKKRNRLAYDCLIEYSFYRPHRSLNFLTPIEYCSKLLNNKDPSML